MSNEYELVEAISSRRKFVRTLFDDISTAAERSVVAFRNQSSNFGEPQTSEALGGLAFSSTHDSFEVRTNSARIDVRVDPSIGAVIITRHSSSSLFQGIVDLCVIEISEGRTVREVKLKLHSHEWLKFSEPQPGGDTPLIYRYAKSIGSTLVERVIEHDVTSELNLVRASLARIGN
jgi:hypothetical protein